LKTFILDVDWSTKGVGAILSQKNGRQKQVIVYANKGLTPLQKCYHPMEGECYALIWGVMHFQQFLHHTFLLLKINHKPLEWPTKVSDANGKWGKWISTLQDFHFKIVHRFGSKHSNVDALRMNHVFVSNEEEHFQVEILDRTIVVSKATMESGNRSFHDKTKIHEIQNIFILLEMTKKRLEQLVEKNS
jgi:hypothetical protein